MIRNKNLAYLDTPEHRVQSQAAELELWPPPAEGWSGAKHRQARDIGKKCEGYVTHFKNNTAECAGCGRFWIKNAPASKFSAPTPRSVDELLDAFDIANAAHRALVAEGRAIKIRTESAWTERQKALEDLKAHKETKDAMDSSVGNRHWWKRLRTTIESGSSRHGVRSTGDSDGSAVGSAGEPDDCVLAGPVQ